MILGAYVYPKQPTPAAAVSLAKISVVAFKSLVNPALAKAYATSFGAFVDVTESDRRLHLADPHRAARRRTARSPSPWRACARSRGSARRATSTR